MGGREDPETMGIQQMEKEAISRKMERILSGT
jgi:hypothetical protein